MRRIWMYMFYSASVAVCGVSLSGWADTIFLTNGVEIEGTVIENSSQSVVIRLANGQTRSIRRHDIDIINIDPSNAAPVPVARPAQVIPPAVSLPEKPVISTTSSDATWFESWEKASAASRESHKPILADFTGSDWCGWCKKLDKEVFETSIFKQWAQQNVVLLKLDFLRKTPQVPTLKKQNEELAKKYSITGYPTILMLDADGRELGRKSGFPEKSPQQWIEVVSKLFIGK